MTTGPLGQGFGTGVGMAMAEAHLRARLGHELVDHRTWGFVSDGDLMEGISYESASLAGHLGLGKLNYFYDDNEISIDGSTDLAFTEDVAARFDAAGWHTVDIDGHDHAAIRQAADEAVAMADRPSLIIAHTHIGHGSPNKQDTSGSHGSPLGVDEIRLTKEGMGWPLDETFTVPGEVVAYLAGCMDRGRSAHEAWQARLAESPNRALFEQLHSHEAVSLDVPDSRPERKDRHAGRHWKDLRSNGRKGARVPRGSGRPGRFHEDRDLIVGRDDCQRLQRPKRGVWNSRTRHGNDSERDGRPWRVAAVRCDVLCVQRLHAASVTARSTHGASLHLELQPRFVLPGRGWPHASANRTHRRSTGDAQHVGNATSRRR